MQILLPFMLIGFVVGSCVDALSQAASLEVPNRGASTSAAREDMPSAHEAAIDDGSISFPALPEFPPQPPVRPVDLAPGGSDPLPFIAFDDSQGLQRITAGPDADETRIIGLELARYGRLGSLVVTRSDDGLMASVTLAGQSTDAADGDPEACLVTVIEDAEVESAEAGKVALTASGRPQGLLRYTLEAPFCPLAIDVLDQSVLIRGPATCVIPDVGCVVRPVGIWTPHHDRLPALGGRSDGIAAIAERAIADNGPALAARSPGSEQNVLRELARARLDDAAECGNFAPGAATRFCEARMAAARAADLSVRLGLYPGEGPLPPRELPPPAPPLRILPEDQPFIANRGRP